MNKNYLFQIMAASLLTCGMFTACSDNDDPNPNGSGNGTGESVSRYVIATTSTISGNESHTLVTSETLTEGSVTVENNGLTNDGATQWVYFNDDYLYGLTYNQGNGGTTVSFILNSNANVEKRSIEYTIRRFTTYGTYNDYIMTTSTGDGPTTTQQIRLTFPKTSSAMVSTLRSPVCCNKATNSSLLPFLWDSVLTALCRRMKMAIRTNGSYRVTKI